MTKLTTMNRRQIMAGGAALGLGAMMGSSALAQDRLSIPYSNKSLDYYFFRHSGRGSEAGS